MPGTVLDLKNKLTGAIDSEGNVLNMPVVLEVIGVLEQTTVTAEELHVSRLGKYVNWIRKQTKDKGLARRIKQLLKQWQKLANSATTQNGLQQKIRDTPTLVQNPVSPARLHSIPSVSSTSISSVPPSASVLSTATTLHSTTVSTAADGVGSTGSKSDAVSNRLKIRSLFSAIKKSESNLITAPPPTTATDNTSTSSRALISSTSAPHFTSAGFSQPILPPLRTSSPLPSLLIEDITPVEPNDSNKRQLSPHAAVSSVDTNGLGPINPTLIANSQPLLVRFPVAHQKSDELEVEQEFENTLIVSISRHLLSNVARSVSPDLPQSLVVSISRKYFDWLSTNNRLHPMAVNDKAQSLPKSPPTSPSPVDLSLSCTPSIGPPPGRLKQTIVGVPMGCSHGVDGCLGADGVWYDWTEYIPGTHEEMVTVLPYVYIDGWEQSS